jgi:uncharacterized membrane protein YhaH (DUF805 family)
MNFQEAVKTCLQQKYATVTGRARRSEFWWFTLFHFGVLFVAYLVSDLVFGLAWLALVVPALCASGRRLHDTGKSAWFLLLGFIPVIGHLLLLYWLVQPSGPDNQFGVREVTAYSTTVMR